MTIATWPNHLRSCVTSSKSRQQTQGFTVSDVQVGPPFVELITEDTPTFYDVSFKFNRSEARAFRAWQKINNFTNAGGWFYLPIQIEEGLTTQEVLLLPPGFQCTGQENNVFSYTASVMTRQEQATDDQYPESILGLFENNPRSDLTEAANLLDIAINESLPEA